MCRLPITGGHNNLSRVLQFYEVIGTCPPEVIGTCPPEVIGTCPPEVIGICPPGCDAYDDSV